MKHDPFAPPPRGTNPMTELQWPKRARTTVREWVVLFEVATLLVVGAALAAYSLTSNGDGAARPSKTDVVRIDYMTDPPTVERGYYDDTSGHFYAWFDVAEPVEVTW